MNKKKTKDKAIAFGYMVKLREMIKQQGVLFLEIGRLLKIIRDEKYFRQLGDYSTWTDFLASGELSLSHTTIYTYIGIYEVFVMKYGFDFDYLAPIPYDKLSKVLRPARIADNADEAREIVEKARTLSRSDLVLEFGQGIPENRTKTRLVKAFRCDDCGKWRIDLLDDEICKCNDKKTN